MSVNLLLRENAELLEWSLEGLPITASAAERPCEMYLDHGSARPAVTQWHHLFPIYLQNRVYGHIELPDLAFLCGTCHDNTHAWLYWLLGERREPTPHPPARAKALAMKAYDWYTEESSG